MENRALSGIPMPFPFATVVPPYFGSWPSWTVLEAEKGLTSVLFFEGPRVKRRIVALTRCRSRPSEWPSERRFSTVRPLASGDTRILLVSSSLGQPSLRAHCRSSSVLLQLLALSSLPSLLAAPSSVSRPLYNDARIFLVH